MAAGMPWIPLCASSGSSRRNLRRSRNLRSSCKYCTLSRSKMILFIVLNLVLSVTRDASCVRASSSRWPMHQQALSATGRWNLRSPFLDLRIERKHSHSTGCSHSRTVLFLHSLSVDAEFLQLQRVVHKPCPPALNTCCLQICHVPAD